MAKCVIDEGKGHSSLIALLAMRYRVKDTSLPSVKETVTNLVSAAELKNLQAANPSK